MKKFKFFVLVMVVVLSSYSFVFARNNGAFPALDFKLPGLDQKAYSLSDYKGKNNVLLFFWTTWCPFCRKEIKKLNARSEELANDRIVVLGINVGEPKAKVEKYVEENGIKLRILLDENGAVGDTYSIMGVPTFFLVDKSGVAVFSDNYFPDDYKGLISKGK